MDYRIILYFKDIPISSLSFDNGNYIYRNNYDNIKIAIKKGCPSFIAGLKDKTSNQIPPIFYEFEVDPGRTELCNKLNIKPEDNRFTRLYKVALNSNKFSKEGLWIDTK